MDESAEQGPETPGTKCDLSGMDNSDEVQKMDQLKAKLVWTEHQLEKTKAAYNTLAEEHFGLKNEILQHAKSIDDFKMDLTCRTKQKLTQLKSTIDEIIDGLDKSFPSIPLEKAEPEVIVVDNDADEQSLSVGSGGGSEFSSHKSAGGNPAEDI